MVPHWYIFPGSGVGTCKSIRGRHTASCSTNSTYAFSRAAMVTSMVRTCLTSSLFRIKVMGASFMGFYRGSRDSAPSMGSSMPSPFSRANW